MPASNPPERKVDHHKECDRSGWVTITVDRNGMDHLVSARCNGCHQEAVLKAAAEFVPPRFRKQIEIPEKIDDWISKGVEAEGLYLTGQTGSGKTQTAYEALTRWCLKTGVMPRNAGHLAAYEGGDRYGPTVVFIRATTLFDLLRPGSDDNRRTVVDCQKAALLVIDDLGAEKPSEWTAERLYEVIDERYVQGKPLIVTSNVPAGKVGEHVGDRVASRFAEMCTVVPITGTDRRIKARAVA